MKRLVSILLVCLMTFSLFGCGNDTAGTESGGSTGTASTMTAAEKNEN